MAKLSNINNLFSVDSTGAIEFSTQVGTTGYVLESRGTGNAPVWTDRDTGRITGSGAANRVTYWTGTYSIGSDAGFTYNGAGRVNTDESFGVSKDGADTVADGPFFRLTNAAATRQYINQLDASNNIDYWYYNGTAWTQTISLLTDGGATFAGIVNIRTGTGTQPSYFHSYLNVQNNASTSDNASITITAGSSGYAGLHFGDSDNGRIGQVAYNNSNNSLLFTANNSTRMTIDSSGNVGIGVTPSLWEIISDSNVLQFYGSYIYNYRDTNLILGNNAYYDGTWKYYKSSIGATKFNSGNGAFDFAVSSSGTANNAITWIEALKIDSSGHVGIRTTPQTTLADFCTIEIGNIGMIMSEKADSQYNSMFVSSNAYYASGWKRKTATVDGSTYMSMYLGGIRFGTAPQGAADSAITWANRLVIANGGNVGIGRDSPDAKLHIYGSASLTEMYLGEDAAADKAGILKYTQGDGSGTGVVTLSHWGNNSNTQSLAIKYGGNVGIGTTSPSEILHLNAPGTGCFIRFQNTGGSGVYIGGRSEVMEMYTNGSEKMRITSAGNVGIGTQAPNQVGYGASSKVLTLKADTSGGESVLELIGLGNADNDQVGVLNFMSQAETTPLASIKGLRHTSDPSGKLTFETSAIERMRIDSYGDVTIQTSGADDIKNLTINSSNGSSQVAGFVIQNDGANGYIHFKAGAGNATPTTKLTIGNAANSGNVGIGTTTPYSSLSVIDNNSFGYFSSTSAYRTATFQGSGSTSIVVAANGNSNGVYSEIRLGNTQATYANYSPYVRATQGNGIDSYSLEFGTSSGGVASTVMYIGGATGTVKGNVGIGTTNPVSAKLVSSYDGTVNNGIAIINTNTGTLVQNLIIFKRNTTEVGSITSNNTTTTYVTSSDYRLKENVVEMTGALKRVSQLKPSRFNFIADADKTVDGFLAHEVQDIVPEAITGEKDGVDEKGNPKYQGIDQSKLVPLLVGAIKELKAEIEILKNK